jgi:CP family cyanate transporter-like MFS transporter
MNESTLSNKEAIVKALPIFIAAINMRAGLTIMSPLIPILKEQYHLSSFLLSFLTSLTVLCFAASAFLMPLVGRIGGTNRVISVALIVLTTAILLRAIGNIPMLFISSLTVGIAIAILNFSLPVWVKENTSEHSGLVTGIYIAIMGTFAAISVAVAVPLARASSWGWRLAMVPWIVIGLVSSIWWIARNSKDPRDSHMSISSKFHWELLRSTGAWSIALFFGLQSMLFYGTATWLPTILVSKGFTLSNAGFAVSITGLMGSVIGIAAPHFSSKLRDLKILLALMGAIAALSVAAIILDHGWRLVLWLFISNIALSVTFPLSLLLTVTRSVEAGETRSLSIMAQSIGYLMAAVSPGIVGAIFDATLNWNIALIFPVILGILLGAVGYFAGKPEKILILRP